MGVIAVEPGCCCAANWLDSWSTAEAHDALRIRKSMTAFRQSSGLLSWSCMSSGGVWSGGRGSASKLLVKQTTGLGMHLPLPFRASLTTRQTRTANIVVSELRFRSAVGCWPAMGTTLAIMGHARLLLLMAFPAPRAVFQSVLVEFSTCIRLKPRRKRTGVRLHHGS